MNSSQLSGTCCLPSSGRSRSCVVAPGLKRQPFQREVGQSGGWRGGGMLFVGTWVPRELYRTRDQKVTVTSADNAPSQGQQPVYHTGCAVGHQDGVVEPVRKPRQQREICLGLGSGVTSFLPYLVVGKSVQLFFFKRKNSTRCYSRLPGIVWQQD